MKKHRFTAILLLAGILSVSFSALSCGNEAASDNTGDLSDSLSSESTEPEQPKVYEYYKDLGGREFNILNVDKRLWNATCYICPEEGVGDTLSDAILKRNLFVEQNLNCTINETNISAGDVAGKIKRMVASDEAAFDAAYVGMDSIKSLIADGCLYDLNIVDSMRFSESWWDTAMMDALSIEGKNYFASSSAHLMGWDLLWCLYFNDKMMEDYGLERPYQLVRDGKWTVDELARYSKTAANLNGDDAYTDEPDGNSRFGTVTFYNGITKFIFSCDALYVTKDKDDVPVIDCGEKFVSVCQKLAGFFSSEGVFMNTDDVKYLSLFTSGRAMFIGAEIKTAQEMRNVEWNFGLVPFPKYDAAQSDYMSTSAHQSAVLTIPVSNTDLENTGLLFDALSFETDRMVLESYFDVTVAQKGLRNDDSIDMLQIIKKGRSYDIGVAYQWFNTIGNVVYEKITVGDGDVVSGIESKKATVQSEIDKTLEAIK